MVIQPTVLYYIIFNPRYDQAVQLYEDLRQS